jgi:hypothetical protein
LVYLSTIIDIIVHIIFLPVIDSGRVVACEGISLLPTGIQWLYLALTCAGADGSQCLRYKQNYVFKPAWIKDKIVKAKQVADLISQATHVNHRDDIIALVNEVFESIYDGDYVCGNHPADNNSGNNGGENSNGGGNNWGDYNSGDNIWGGGGDGDDDDDDDDDDGDKKNRKGKKKGKKDKSNRNKAVTKIDKNDKNDDDADFNYLTLDRDFHNSFNGDFNNNNNYQGNNYQGNINNNNNTGIVYDNRGDEIPLILQQFNRASNANSNILDILQVNNHHHPHPPQQQQQQHRPPPPPPPRNQNSEKQTSGAKNAEKQKEGKRAKREKKDLKPSQVVKKGGKK